MDKGRKPKEGPENAEKMLVTISQFKLRCGYYPNYRQIMEFGDISSLSVVGYYMNILEKHGHIVRLKSVRRYIIPEIRIKFTTGGVDYMAYKHYKWLRILNKKSLLKYQK